MTAWTTITLFWECEWCGRSSLRSCEASKELGRVVAQIMADHAEMPLPICRAPLSDLTIQFGTPRDVAMMRARGEH